MSGFDYPRMAATARRLIDRFGQVMSITRTASDRTVTSLSAVGVVTDTVKHTLGDSGIAIGDDQILLDATTKPQPGDRITYNGQSRVIVDPVTELNPGGVALLFECYARAG